MANTKVELEKELLRAKIRSSLAQARHEELRYRQLKREMAEQDASDDAACTFLFNSVVSTSSVEACLTDLAVWARRDPKAPFTIIFDSPGGSVIDGLHLYDALQEFRRQGHHVTTVALGMAASMGGVLLQAGDIRIMGRFAWMLIHEVSSSGRGKTSDMEDELKLTKRLQGQLLDILSERSSLTKRQIANRWRRKDWWISADECLEYGFVDEIR